MQIKSSCSVKLLPTKYTTPIDDAGILNLHFIACLTNFVFQLEGRSIRAINPPLVNYNPTSQMTMTKTQGNKASITESCLRLCHHQPWQITSATPKLLNHPKKFREENLHT